VKQLFELVEWENYYASADNSTSEITLTIGRVGQSNPSGLIVAGVHGDEGPWGAWAIRKLIEETREEDLLGSLRLVLVANPLAMEANTRNAPIDSLDLNRSFPGSKDGTYTEQVAAILSENAVKGADVVIDLHGGGSWCVNAFTFRFSGCRDLSEAFGAPFTIKGQNRTNTLTGYARSKGARVVAVEMGGKGRDEELWATRIAEGLRRALGIAGILTPIEEEAEFSLPVSNSTVLSPTDSGIFLPLLKEVDVGTIVQKDTILGRMLEPKTMNELEVFKAPYSRTAILLLRPTLSYLERGAMTYVVAQVKSEGN
jgi:predicted deacylase